MEKNEQEFELRDRVVLPLHQEELLRCGLTFSKYPVAIIATKNDIQRMYKRWIREGSPDPNVYSLIPKNMENEKRIYERMLRDKIADKYAQILQEASFFTRLKYLFTGQFPEQN